jgi:TRAP-type C4-dicarboxylate transport system permease small subunit
MKKIKFSNLKEVLSGILLILIVIDILMAIIARNVFNRPFTWTIELSSILIIWSVYLVFGTNYKDNSHLSVDLLVPHYPPRLKKIYDIFKDLIIIITLIIIIIYCAIAMIINYGWTTMALDISVSLAYYLAAGIGSISMLFYILLKYYKKIGGHAS